MGASAQPLPRETVINALVLAFSKSPLAGLTHDDGFRAVLSIDYSEVVRDGRLDLQMLWELLEERPGFDTDAAVGPICQLKSWESQFALAISLPTHLAEVSKEELALRIGRCSVPADAVKKTFEAKPQAQALILESGISVQPLSGHAITWKERRGVATGAAIAAVVALAAAGFITLREFRGGSWEERAVGELGSKIPLQDPQKLGDQIGATLSDDSWLRLPEDQRRVQMREALQNLADEGVTVFFVRDRGGTVRASASFYDSPAKISVMFY